MNRTRHPLRSAWEVQALAWLNAWVAAWQADTQVLGAMLTGSYAEGQGGPGSDLDVLLVTQAPAPLQGWYVPGDPYTLDITRIAPTELAQIAQHPTAQQVSSFGRGRILLDKDGGLAQTQAALKPPFTAGRRLSCGEGNQLCLALSRSLAGALPLERRGTILAPLQLLRTLWLALETYPATHGLWPESIPGVLRRIERSDPTFYALVAAATLEPPLEELATLVTQIVDYVLAPVGGRIQTGEPLILARDEASALAAHAQWESWQATVPAANNAPHA